MKKVLCGLLMGFLLAGGALLQAQETKLHFSLNAGVQTNVFKGSSFDKALLTVDARVGIMLGRAFEVSPEAMVVFNYASALTLGFVTGGTLVYPGVMLNYRSSSFFAGIGAVLPWWFFEGSSDTGRIAPKVNIGYTFGNLQLTAYFIAWNEEDIDFLNLNWAGVTLGFRF